MAVTLRTWTARVVLWALLAAVVSTLAVLTVVPRAVGGAALTVLTGSMAPDIPVGAVVVVRPVDPQTLQVGDVVTYQTSPGEGSYVTHRITDIHRDTTPVSLTTQGDANYAPDEDPVPVTAVRGKVLFSVPYLGTLRSAVSVGGSGLLLLALGLAGYAGLQLVSALRDRRDAPAGRAARHASGELVVVEPGGLSLQTLVITLPLREFEGFSAGLVARLLRVDLVDEGPDTFTVAVTREPDQVDELLALLEPFGPVAVTRSAVLRVPPCARTAAPPSAPVPDLQRELSHVAA